MSTQSKAKRAAKKAEKASQKAIRLQMKAEAKAGKPPVRWGRRILILTGVLVVAGGVAGGIWYWQDQQRQEEVANRPASISVEQLDGLGQTILVEGGRATIDEVVAAPAVAEAGLATADGTIITLGASVRAGTDGYLSIRNRTVRLRSDPEAIVSLQAEGANLVIDNSTITSWNGTGPDEEYSDGRAYISIVDSALSITNSEIVALGSDSRGQSGLTVARDTEGTINDLAVQEPYVGMEFRGDLPLLTVDDVDITKSTLAGFRFNSTSGLRLTNSSANQGKGDGLLVEGSTESVFVSELDTAGNQGHGISFTGAAGDVTVTASRSYRNEGRGVSVANTRGVSLTDNALWANNSGIGFTGANAASIVTGNTVTGNRGGGIELASAGTTVDISGNTLDHNEYGLRIADGTATVSLNEIVQNGIGVLLEDTSPKATFTRNAVVTNFDTGFSLAETEGVIIEGNQILENDHAAFTVKFVGTSEAYWANNEVDSGRFGVERLYEPLREDRALADLTPIPAYFFAEEGRAFADLAQGGNASTGGTP